MCNGNRSAVLKLIAIVLVITLLCPIEAFGCGVTRERLFKFVYRIYLSCRVGQGAGLVFD